MAVALSSKCRLTVKLRGRPEAPDQAPRAHNLFRARGADTQAVHGPLQRLLGVAQTKTARIQTYQDPNSDNYGTDAHLDERYLQGHSGVAGNDLVPWLCPSKRNHIGLNRSRDGKPYSVKYHRKC